MRSGFAGVRVFAGRRRGFAIANLRRAADGTYPLATTDGGQTWRTAGPVLHVPAAQGPVGVDQAGVAGQRLYFAWCGACNSVIDVTPDAGRDWWQTFMPGTVVAVFSTGDQGGLIAITQGEGLWVYRSVDGRRWTYERSL